MTKQFFNQPSKFGLFLFELERDTKPIQINSRHCQKFKILENQVKPLFTDRMTEVLTPAHSWERHAGLSRDDQTLSISLFTSVHLSSGSFREV